MLGNASCKGKNRRSFRVTVLLFAVSVRFQSRPTRFHSNEESDEPLGRRRDRRRLRKLVVSIGVRVARVRQLIEYRVSRSSAVFTGAPITGESLERRTTEKTISVRGTCDVTSFRRPGRCSTLVR